MNIYKISERLSRRMKWYDFSLLKLGVMLMTLFLITIWDGFRELIMTVSPYVYLVLALLIFIPLWKKMFTK